MDGPINERRQRITARTQEEFQRRIKLVTALRNEHPTFKEGDGLTQIRALTGFEVDRYALDLPMVTRGDLHTLID